MLERARRYLSGGLRDLSSVIFSPDAATQTPVVHAITTPYNLSDIMSIGNIYQVCDSLVDWDGDIQGILARLGHMCRMSYNGIYIEAGQRLDVAEEDLLEAAKYTAEMLDFEAELMSISFDLSKYGDVVKHMVWDVNEGVTELQTIPRTALTAVENRGQIGQVASIYHPNFYVFNEGGNTEEVFEAETCVHIPLNNKSSILYDLRNRTTYNIWSKSPMMSLLATMKWKLNSVINDILWTHRNVPREHHQLDLSMYTPEAFTGTPEERFAKAEAAALAAARTYHSNMQDMKADVGYVTDMNTKIGYVEPKSTNYQAPNEKIAQINDSISNCLGLSPVTRQQSFAGALMSGSFAVLMALSISKIAAKGLEKVIRKSLAVQFGPRFTERDLRKVKVRLRLILEKDRSEVMRQIAIMVDANRMMPTFTPTEIREEWGKEALTESQFNEIVRYMQYGEKGLDVGSTISQIVKDEKRVVRNRPENWPDYESEKGRRDELR